MLLLPGGFGLLKCSPPLWPESRTAKARQFSTIRTTAARENCATTYVSHRTPLRVPVAVAGLCLHNTAVKVNSTDTALYKTDLLTRTFITVSFHSAGQIRLRRPNWMEAANLQQLALRYMTLWLHDEHEYWCSVKYLYYSVTVQYQVSSIKYLYYSILIQYQALVQYQAFILFSNGVA